MKGITQQVREILEDGPATAREIGLEMKVSYDVVKAGLWGLRKQHELVVMGTIPNLEIGRGQARNLKLYGLTSYSQSRAA